MTEYIGRMGSRQDAEMIVRHNLRHIHRKFCELSGLEWREGMTELSVVEKDLTQEEAQDMGGDLNHVFRVVVRMKTECRGREESVCALGGHEELRDRGGGTSHQRESRGNAVGSNENDQLVCFIVKTAPMQVLFAEREWGETLPLEQRKADQEYAVLCHFYETLPGSVPRPYFLDFHHRSIVMEDVSHYRKMEELLTEGEVKPHLSAIASALGFIGLIHHSTWLAGMEEDRRKMIKEKFHNPRMKELMAGFLFDRPYKPSDPSNKCNPQVSSDLHTVHNDPTVLSRVKELRSQFITQEDCLCHGDFSTDNVLVNQKEFKVLDLEFAGIGLRAYDVGLYLETLLFRLIYHHYKGNQGLVSLILHTIGRAVAEYEESCGQTLAREPQFVGQVTGLIGCEEMWRVLGGAEVTEFGGDPGPERKLLAMGRDFMMSHCSVTGPCSINTVVVSVLSKHGIIAS